MGRVLSIIFLILLCSPAFAASGFYADKDGNALLSESSKIVIARDGNRTVLTLVPGYKGEAKTFAIILPIPVPVEKTQVNVADPRTVIALESYTAPRLAEYEDPDPCRPSLMDRPSGPLPPVTVENAASMGMVRSIGLKPKEYYAAADYDIDIVPAKEILATLKKQGYVIPDRAGPAFKSYIGQDMTFVIARVSLRAVDGTKNRFLPPLQVAYESPKFFLPLRFGAVNANAPEDIHLFTLTRTGRVDPSNYRTIRLPTGDSVPLFVAEEFEGFYNSLFTRRAGEERTKTVFLEHAWDMAWCEPCVADPVKAQDLRTLGAWWVEKPKAPRRGEEGLSEPPVNVFVTRMRLSYTPESFPDDMVLQPTEDRQNFQVAFVMRRPWTGEAGCEPGKAYFRDLPSRFAEEGTTLATLTGWDKGTITAKMAKAGQPQDIQPPVDERPWWEKMWEKPKTK